MGTKTMGCGPVEKEAKEEEVHTEPEPKWSAPVTFGRYVVQNVFSNVLRRGYTKAEYEFHANRIDSHEISPVGFFWEILQCDEFNNLGIDGMDPRNFVRILMRIFINRGCNDEELDFHSNRLANEEICHQGLAQEFAMCEEAKARYMDKRGSGQAGYYMAFGGNENAYYLQQLFHGVLARGPNEKEFKHHLGRLDSGESRGCLMHEFFTCDEVKQRGLGDAEEVPPRWIIRGIFIACLNRQPGANGNAEEWDFHANCLSEGMSVEDKCNEFATCDEFKDVMNAVCWDDYGFGECCDDDGFDSQAKWEKQA